MNTFVNGMLATRRLRPNVIFTKTVKLQPFPLENKQDSSLYLFPSLSNFSLCVEYRILSRYFRTDYGKKSRFQELSRNHA
jgi:hypothetical protein